VAKFKESLSALGHFWPSQKPANKWPGRVFVDKFPGARLHCMGERPGDGIHPFGRMTFHGITEGNEYVTMLEAQGAIGGQALKPDRSWTESIAVTANYMLVGAEHFDEIAERAMATPWVPRNPRKIDGPARLREILQLAA